MAEGIHFAVGGAVYGGDISVADIELTARLGFPGVEPYRGRALSWLERPAELKRVLDSNGVKLITCSNGGPGESTDFIDPASRQRTIDDHVKFARDFLSVFGCTYYKINMGRRPASGTTDEQIKAIAETINQLGKETARLGIRIAPHPHIWGPIERPEEIHRLLELTDPAIVWWIPDTAQLNLGGGDPDELMSRYYDRIAAVHWKDSRAEYRGHRGPTPTTQEHEKRILYQDLGAGGVDIQSNWKLLLDRGYKGWITLDLDPPRANEGEGTVEDKLMINRRYLTDTLKVETL